MSTYELCQTILVSEVARIMLGRLTAKRAGIEPGHPHHLPNGILWKLDEGPLLFCDFGPHSPNERYLFLHSIVDNVHLWVYEDDHVSQGHGNSSFHSRIGAPR